MDASKRVPRMRPGRGLFPPFRTTPRFVGEVRHHAIVAYNRAARDLVATSGRACGETRSGQRASLVPHELHRRVACALIPGVLTLVMGERMLSLTPSSGATFVIPDTGMYGAVFASIGLPIYLGACLLTSAQRLLQRRNCRESDWAAMAAPPIRLPSGRSSCLASHSSSETWPVGVVHYVSGLDLAPLLVLIVAIANRMVPIIIAIVLAAIIHVAVFRCTRDANPARPFPPAPSHA